MADEKQVEGESNEPVQEEVKTERTLDDIKAELQAEFEAKYREKDEQAKKEIAGLNRKITEQEREKLSEEEKAKAELEDMRAETEKIRQEAADLSRKRAIDSALYEADLPADIFEGRIQGQSEEEIKNDVLKVKEYISTLAEKAADARIQEALKGKAPSRQVESGSERDRLIAQYNEAETKADVPTMMALKDKIRKLKE